jgi:hypothetical protein
MCLYERSRVLFRLGLQVAKRQDNERRRWERKRREEGLEEPRPYFQPRNS